MLRCSFALLHSIRACWPRRYRRRTLVRRGLASFCCRLDYFGTILQKVGNGMAVKCLDSVRANAKGANAPRLEQELCHDVDSAVESAVGRAQRSNLNRRNTGHHRQLLHVPHSVKQAAARARGRCARAPFIQERRTLADAARVAPARTWRPRRACTHPPAHP